jgi:hypothetical protein
MSTHAQNKHQSALTFYSVNYEEVADMDYQIVWDNYVITDLAHIRCTNIGYFTIPPSTLSAILRNGIEVELEDVLCMAKEELTEGANFMFVQPMNGRPVDGFHIKQFIASVI